MIKFIDAKTPFFWELLAQLGLEVGWQSPLYTRSSFNYYQQRARDVGNKVSDRSFLMLHENHPVAAFLGTLVGTSDEKQDLLAFEIPCHVIENIGKLTTAVSKRFIREIDLVVQEVSGVVRFRDFLVSGRVSAFSQYLLSKGGSASPAFLKVIDLSNEEAYLKAQLRKSYGSLVNWGIRELNPVVVGKDNVTLKMVEEFRQLHIREAGRETRSEASWKRQYEMVQAGEAFLVFGKLEEQLVSAGLFVCSETTCYYGVSASRRDLFKKPLFHSLMWVAILYAKKNKCQYFEVGEQLYPNHPQSIRPTRKELGVSDFKAGFGGQTKMYLDILLVDSVCK